MNGNQRLAVLADWLENNVKDEVFNMSAWSCGTRACAVGHACCCPALMAEGLHIEESGPVFKDYHYGWEATEKFFELYTHDSYVLFGPDGDGYGLLTHQVKPRHVAAAIRNHLGYDEVTRLLAEVKIETKVKNDNERIDNVVKSIDQLIKELA